MVKRFIYMHLHIHVFIFIHATTERSKNVQLVCMLVNSCNVCPSIHLLGRKLSVTFSSILRYAIYTIELCNMHIWMVCAVVNAHTNTQMHKYMQAYINSYIHKKPHTCALSHISTYVHIRHHSTNKNKNKYPFTHTENNFYVTEKHHYSNTSHRTE